MTNVVPALKKGLPFQVSTQIEVPSASKYLFRVTACISIFKIGLQGGPFFTDRQYKEKVISSCFRDRLLLFTFAYEKTFQEDHEGIWTYVLSCLRSYDT